MAEELGGIAEELVTLDPRATNELVVVPARDVDGNDDDGETDWRGGTAGVPDVWPREGSVELSDS